MPKMPASHDPAQPKGQPEPGDPRIQAKIDSGELPPPEEEEAPPPEEELDHDGQVQKLVDDNTREALIELADKEDVNIGSGDTKSDIAEAIVCKREEEKGE